MSSVGRGAGQALWIVALGAVSVGLTACNGGPATQKNSGQTAAGAPAAAPMMGEDRGGPDRTVASTGGADLPAADPRREPVPLFQGKPMWAANRRHTAQENAEYEFNRDGPDFGAQSVNDYVAKAHAFVDTPPEGVQTLTRANGDRLIYDPRGNVFAVVTRQGAPRTMFKPRDGETYWEEQKARVAEEASSGDSSGSRRYESRGSGGSDDQG